MSWVSRRIPTLLTILSLWSLSRKIVSLPNSGTPMRNASPSVVRSKLKCPVFLAHDMSGSKVNQQPSGLWESGNPAGLAGFPSEVGKSAL